MAKVPAVDPVRAGNRLPTMRPGADTQRIHPAQDGLVLGGEPVAVLKVPVDDG